MNEYSVSGITGIWMEQDQHVVAPYTSEQFVIDEDGVRLKDKLKHLSVSAITLAQSSAEDSITALKQEALSAITEQQASDRDCIADLYEQLFPLKHNFKVVANKNVSGCTAVYHITGRDGVDVTPDSVVITLKVNDEVSGTTILEYNNFNSKAYDATPAHAIAGAVQEYTLEATKSGRTDVSIVRNGISRITSTVRKYVVMYGALPLETLDLLTISSENFAKLKKVLADGLTSNPTITTNSGDYIWIVVPKELSINKVTCAGFDIPMESPVDEKILGAELYNGFYKAYRSSQKLGAHAWKLVVNGDKTISAVENETEQEEPEANDPVVDNAANEALNGGLGSESLQDVANGGA